MSDDGNKADEGTKSDDMAPKSDGPPKVMKTEGKTPKNDAKVDEAKSPNVSTKVEVEKSEMMKDSAKGEGAKVAEAKADVGAAEGGGAVDGAHKKTVKTRKNQFALNRLLLMLMDIKPESLSKDTIEDLKKIYALLVNIHATGQHAAPA